MSKPNITRRQFVGGLAAFGAATGLAVTTDASIIEPRRLVIERVEVHIARLPREWEGLKIVQLSDFHYVSSGSFALVRDAVDKANALNPDLVALTGDFVTALFTHSQMSDVANARACAATLRELRASMGVFAVLGNHDYAHNPQLIARALDTNGVAVLRNYSLRVERAGARLWVAGVDSVLGGGARLEQALHGIPQDEPTILLAHEPDFADAVSRYPVDLQVSGHSHGGQVCLPVVGPPYLPVLGRKYPAGLRKLGSLSLYTNRGLGTTGVPVRLNSPPEVTLLTLRSGWAEEAVGTTPTLTWSRRLGTPTA